jgi:PAS domain S-box-containing protein
MARSPSAAGRKKPAASHHTLDQFFQHNPLPMWVYDLETLAFLSVNDAAIEKYGYSEAEFLRMTIKDIRPVEELPALLTNLGRQRPVLESGAEWRHRTKDGRILLIEINSHLTEFNGRKAVLVVANDVTQRKIAELALRESEGRLRAQAELVENISDAIISCDVDFHIITWNRAAENVYGWKLEEVIGQDWDELCQTKYAGTTREQLVDELFTTGKWSGELEQKRKDGERIYIQSRISIVRNEVGTPVRLATANRDISRRRMTEVALRESQRQLSTLMSNLPGMAYRCQNDPEWTMEFVSDGCDDRQSENLLSTYHPFPGCRPGP